MADESGRKGDFKGAAAHYRLAYAIIAEDLDADPATTALVMENAAIASVRAEDYGLAVQIYDDLVRLNGEVHGERSIGAADATIDLARVYMRLKDHGKAAPLYRLSLIHI